jgi:hypothetical protein
MAATPPFVLAVAYLGRQAAKWPPMVRARTPAPRNRRPARVWIPALGAATVGLIMIVALGAAKYGGVRTPPAHVTAKSGLRAQSWPPT